MQTQQLCPLFQLPPENRNCIYEMTFECDLNFIDIATAFAQGRAIRSRIRRVDADI